MIGWWKCRRQAELAILRRELKTSQNVAKFYRDMATRLARENEHYRKLAGARGAAQDEEDFRRGLDVLGAA